MSHEITGCCAAPRWLPPGMRLADIDDDLEIDQDDVDQEALDSVRGMPPDQPLTEAGQQLLNPDDWGKGGKRPIAVNQSAKRRAAKLIYEAMKGWHDSIPLSDVFLALSWEGLVPIQEDGTRWAGVLAGGAECGSDEARGQHADIPIAGKNANNLWCMTTAMLHLSWCKMHSGRYEVVCYLS